MGSDSIDFMIIRLYTATTLKIVGGSWHAYPDLLFPATRNMSLLKSNESNPVTHFLCFQLYVLISE